MFFDNKQILITGGTGSVGCVLLKRLLEGGHGTPKRIVVLSRDEAKQSAMKAAYAMDEKLKDSFTRRVQFRVGDVRDYSSLVSALDGIDVVFNAAALKQVPSCEDFPYEEVRTNIGGPENIVRVIQQCKYPVEVVVGISTDKACKPVSVMGMTKAIQERLFLSASQRCPDTRFVCTRYGNLLASTGSVVPLFKEQIKKGGPVTVTVPNMTRFLSSLDAAVDIVFAAAETGQSGETYIPRLPSARIIDMAKAMIGSRQIDIKVSGIRPGEKMHELLVSEDEARRTFERDGYYVIASVLSEFKGTPCLKEEFSSERIIMSLSELIVLLKENGVLSD